MTARVGYVLGALLLGVVALGGVHFSSATFTDGSTTDTQVKAARDWTAPTVSVDDPGFVISGIVNISATASDEDTSVASVEIQYAPGGSDDWTTICTDDASPWSCSWDTDSATVPDGVYDLRAIATDIDGNAETSATVTTEVYNTAGVVMDPMPNPVSGTVTLSAHMVNVQGSSTITFEGAPAGTQNWLPLCTRPGPEASCSFDTTDAPDGTYDVRAAGRRGPRTYYDVQTGIVVDNTAPTVTVNQAAGQADPSSSAPISFAVVFSEPVIGFEADDVLVGGTSSGTKVVSVTGSGATYTVAVSGMSGDGTVTVMIQESGATDEAGNGNRASTSTDNSVTYKNVNPTVTINQASSQVDPTNSGSAISFTVIFNKTVSGFTASDVTLSGSAGGAKTVAVSGGGPTYTVAVSGATGNGTVIASIVAGAALDSGGRPNLASTSTDNSVTRDITPPTVTINQAASQADPTNAATINYSVVFNEPVKSFATGDVSFTGTVTGTKVGTVTGSGATYNVAVTGMTSDGTVMAAIAASTATDLAGNNNAASTSTDNTVTRDTSRPSVTVARATGQSTPTTSSPINFRVTFSEAVTNFQSGDLTIAGTAGGTKVTTVTGSGTTYNVAVTGMTSDGTLIASVAPNVANDAAGNLNTGSGGDTAVRTVTWSNGLAPSVTVNQTDGQPDPTNGSSISFTAVFSEPVTGVAATDFNLTSTVGGTRSLTVVNATTYVVTITGMNAGASGTVRLSLPANQAADGSGALNSASTSTDNIVTRDVVAPTVTVTRAAGQDFIATGPTINFTVTFSEPVMGFDGGDITLSGPSGSTATVTGNGVTYNVAVSGMRSWGLVTASVAAARATDAAGNTNTASTGTGNSVFWID